MLLPLWHYSPKWHCSPLWHYSHLWPYIFFQSHWFHSLLGQVCAILWPESCSNSYNHKRCHPSPAGQSHAQQDQDHEGMVRHQMKSIQRATEIQLFFKTFDFNFLSTQIHYFIFFIVILVWVYSYDLLFIMFSIHYPLFCWNKFIQLPISFK